MTENGKWSLALFDELAKAPGINRDGAAETIHQILTGPGEIAAVIDLLLSLLLSINFCR